MDKPIKSWFELEGKVVPYVDKALNVDQVGLEKIDSTQLVGIEVELENSNVTMRLKSQVWDAHGDGSLRNAGLEWISRPIPANTAPAALDDLFSGGADKCCFTPRTSVHVHFNCRDLGKDHVLDVVLVYMFFERRLYNFVGRNRIKNIYCVPINETGLAEALLTRRFDRVVVAWKKYTGLNLIPLRSKGTIEFRQMHGTSDVRKLSIWVRMITRMFQWCEKQGTGNVRKILSDIWNEAELEKIGEEIFESDWIHLKGVSGSKYDIMTAKEAFTSPVSVNDLELESFHESPFALFKRKGA